MFHVATILYFTSDKQTYPWPLKCCVLLHAMCIAMLEYSMYYNQNQVSLFFTVEKDMFDIVNTWPMDSDWAFSHTAKHSLEQAVKRSRNRSKKRCTE